MLTCTRRLHTVGQGLFHTGAVSLGDASFHHVYDCGSENHAPLAEAVNGYIGSASPEVVGALFVSHLDNDHVCGLDQLLAKVKVETVFLPYLTPAERLMVIARGLAGDDVSGNLVLCAGDPARWFLDRGVDQVVFVDGDDRPDGPTPILPPDPPTVPADPEGVEKILLGDDVFSNQVADPLVAAQGEVYRIPHTLPIVLRTNMGVLLNWMFLTFVHPEGERVQAFRTRLRAAFPDLPIDRLTSQAFAPSVQEILASSGTRRVFADCYGAIRGDRNLTSMSLYSGPIPSKGSAYSVHSVRAGDRTEFEKALTSLDPGRDLYGGFIKGGSSSNSLECGLIATGDAGLGSARRRKAFLRHYERVSPLTAVLVLPHHGSAHNFDEELLLPNLRFAVASAGTSNPYHHPHDDVVDAVRAGRRHFHKVTEEPGSIFFEKIRIHSSKPTGQARHEERDAEIVASNDDQRLPPHASKSRQSRAEKRQPVTHGSNAGNDRD
jgi:hypothetical protein